MHFGDEQQIEYVCRRPGAFITSVLVRSRGGPHVAVNVCFDHASVGELTIGIDQVDQMLTAFDVGLRDDVNRDLGLADGHEGL